MSRVEPILAPLRPWFTTLMHRPLRLIIGAGSFRQEGWLSSDYAEDGQWLPRPWRLADHILPLDITKEAHWAALFRPGSITRMLSEHVFEHLTDADLARGLALCRRYLAPRGRLRIAVPDGHRPDARYIDGVAPPADGHLHLFTVESLVALIEAAGFQAEPIEHYDATGRFHRRPYDEADGIVLRCYSRDRQADFQFADHFYTSIIVDAVKGGS